MSDTSLTRKHSQYKNRLKCGYQWKEMNQEYHAAHTCKKLKDHMERHQCNCGKNRDQK